MRIGQGRMGSGERTTRKLAYPFFIEELCA